MKKIVLITVLLFIYTTYSFSQTIKKDSLQKTPTKIDKHPILENRFIFNVGVYVPSKTIRIRADGSSPNSEVDFNEAFDLNKSESTLAMNFIWRFSKNKKWSFGIEYFNVKGGHQVTAEKDIEWQDVIYKAGATVESEQMMSMYRIFFGRTISSGLKHELGVGLGIHAMDLSTFIQGEAFIDDMTTKFERRSVNAVAPFPNTGLWYIFTPSSKWALTARVDWLAISIGEYSGSLWNLAPGLKYQVFKNVGIGMNYRYFKTSLKVDKQNWNGNFSFLLKGPLFTISSNF